MNGTPLFGLDSYHILMVLIGTGVLLAYWLPRFITGWDPAASALLTLFGLVFFTLVPGMPAPPNPLTSPKIWEVTSELAVIVALFGTGLRIDRIGSYRRWQPTTRLLLVAMPLTIAMVAFLGWSFAGMTVAGSILLGAVLAPTDPVLAGDVQVGPPQEGGEHPVRFSLTTEAGLNDGLAFPFVYLGILIGAEGFTPDIWGWEWLLRDVVYRTVMGVAGGAATGWLLGRILFRIPYGNALALKGPGVIAIAGVLLCYGATELIEGYGFIAAFVSGIVLRRAEEKSRYHQNLHSFSESVEHAISAVILFVLGGALPQLLPALTWKQFIIAVALILVIRPAAGWIALGGTRVRGRARGVVAFYGVRGIGSIYYLSYAASKVEFWDEAKLWATIAFTIFVSTIIHGLTAGSAVKRVTLGRYRRNDSGKA